MNSIQEKIKFLKKTICIGYDDQEHARYYRTDIGDVIVDDRQSLAYLVFDYSETYDSYTVVDLDYSEMIERFKYRRI